MEHIRRFAASPRPRRVAKEAAVAAVILASVAGLWWYVGFYPIAHYPGDLGSADRFGGAFGFVGALFSGLAFAGVVYAILLQREELGLQREELILTRQQIERGAVAQERSEKALVEQSRTMLTAAKLEAANSLAQAYKDRMSMQPSGPAAEESRVDFERHRQLLAILLHQIHSGGGPTEWPGPALAYLDHFAGSIEDRWLRLRVRDDRFPWEGAEHLIRVLRSEVSILLIQDGLAGSAACSGLEVTIGTMDEYLRKYLEMPALSRDAAGHEVLREGQREIHSVRMWARG